MTNEKQLSKLLGILVDHMFLFKNLSTEDAQWVIQNPKEAISLFIKAITERSKTGVKSIFTPFTQFHLEHVSKHSTKDCFQDEKGIKFWRDDDLDRWTPQKRKAHKGGEYVVNSLTERASFREMAADILGINLKTEEISNKELQKQLIKDGHCVEMKQIDQEIKRFESGTKDSPIAKDGNWTFFFVDNQDGSVSVVRVYWNSVYGEWHARITRFGIDYRWGPERRVVSSQVS